MELYQKAFGTNFVLGFDLQSYPMLTDRSWGNDVSPSFYFKQNDNYFVLWVDYQTKELRENEDSARYVIQLGTNYGDELNPEIYAEDNEILIQSDDFINIAPFIKMII